MIYLAPSSDILQKTTLKKVSKFDCILRFLTLEPSDKYPHGISGDVICAFGDQTDACQVYIYAYCILGFIFYSLELKKISSKFNN